MDRAIAVDGLCWRYEANELWTLKDVSFYVDVGEIFGIMGPSGAGKSTLCLCLNGLIPQRSRGTIQGRVLVKGMDVSSAPIHVVSQKVGTVFQDPETQFLAMTVEDEIAFGLENLGVPPSEIRERIEWVAHLTRIEEILDKHPYEVSGGQKQRVAIASTLAMKPEVLVMDEPTSDLDPLGKSEIFRLIRDLNRQLGVTVVIVEHDAEELAQCVNRIALLVGGQIQFQGKTREFFTKVAALRDAGVAPLQVTELCETIRQKVYAGCEPALSLEDTALLIRRLLGDQKIDR